MNQPDNLIIARRNEVQLVNDIEDICGRYGDILNMMEIAGCLEVAKSGIVRRWYDGLEKQSGENGNAD